MDNKEEGGQLGITSQASELLGINDEIELLFVLGNHGTLWITIIHHIIVKNDGKLETEAKGCMKLRFLFQRLH